MSPRRAPHEARLVQLRRDVGERCRTEPVRIVGEPAFVELVTRRPGRAPPLQTGGHGPDGGPKGGERTSLTGVDVGGEDAAYLPDHGIMGGGNDLGHLFGPINHTTGRRCASQRTFDPCRDGTGDGIAQFVGEVRQSRFVVGQRRLDVHPLRLR